MIEVVTYANKKAGMFDELINNEYGVPIKVLGWGTTWNGLMDKFYGLYDYLQTKNDNDIVVFLDAFDTKINKNTTDLKLLFESFNCKVLFSADNILPTSWATTCVDGHVANTGMYMGYVNFLKILLKDTFNKKCTNDQRNMNKICKKYDFIKVDTENKIFQNFNIFEKNQLGCYVCFVSI